ncbi:hypothetical protein ACFVU2_19760 [Leifsonia sp. NPDC058194]|uniref:hypothetical protein n=1 Tax=Leifsonia sp. NPDC058194 TaxID=3346374 RepID=UPI0036D90A19
MSTFRGFVFENVTFPAASLPGIIERYGRDYLIDREDRLEISDTDTVSQILDTIAEEAGASDEDPTITVTETGDVTFKWSRGLDDIANSTSDDLTGLLDFAAPGATVTVRDEYVEGGEFRLVRREDAVHRYEPELAYPELGILATPRPTPEQLAAVIEFAERGIARELGAVDHRHHYTAEELATMKARFDNANAGLTALRASAA